jgi:hypothetical protein
LMRNFMKEFYSPTKTQSLRNKVDTFVQLPMETIKKAWSVSMNACKPNSLSGISISFRGGWRRWR